MKILVASLMLSASLGVAQAQVNTQYGQQAGNSEQSNAYISVFGYQALYACTYCYGTTAVGANALRVSSGSYNTSVGFNSMYNGTSGSYNTAIGTYSLIDLGSGSQNVAIGYYSGSGATVNGSNNIWINNQGLAKDDRVIRIGTQGTQKFTAIAGIFGVKLPATTGGQALYVNSKGQIGVLSTTIVHAQPMVSQADFDALKAQLNQMRWEMVALKAQVQKR
jgi:hypothetical protein